MEPAPAYSLADTHNSSGARSARWPRSASPRTPAQVDQDAAFPWDGFKASVEMELPALGIPVNYGGAGADHGHPGDHGGGAGPGVRVDERDHAHLQARDDAHLQLGLRAPEGAATSPGWRRARRRRATASRRPTPAATSPPCGAGRCATATTTCSSGTKYWITNAGVSDTYTVFAKTDPDAGHRGISCFVVEADWGVKVAKLEHKMGLRGSPTGEVVFDDVRVPVENRIGEEGQGFTIAMHTLDRSRPPSAPRPWASPRAPSTTRPAT